jgi:hypothetical protein
MGRINFFAVIAILTAFCFLWAGYVQAANVTAQVIKIASSAAGWSGSVRVIPTLIKAGNVAKWLVGTCSPASLAIMGAAVLGQYALEHPEQLEKLGAWLNYNAYRINNGQYQKSTTTGGMVPGSAGDVGLAAYNVWMNAAYGVGWGGWSTEVVQNNTAYNARKAQLLAGNAYTQTGAYHSEAGIIANNTFVKQGCVPGPYCGVIALVIPYNPADYTSSTNWNNVAASAVVTTWNNDWIGTPPAVATQLWENMEKKIEAGQAQELVNASSNTIMDYASNQTGKTVKDVISEQMKLNVGSTAITNIENEGDTTTITQGGDVTNIINNQTTTIENAKQENQEGVVNPPAVPGAYTKTYQGVGTRFNTFWQAVRSSAMFNTVNSFFNYNPGSGSCSTTINMGNFGTVNYSFCDWAGFLTILRGVFLVAFAFVSIRIVSLKH